MDFSVFRYYGALTKKRCFCKGLEKEKSLSCHFWDPGASRWEFKCSMKVSQSQSYMNATTYLRTIHDHRKTCARQLCRWSMALWQTNKACASSSQTKPSTERRGGGHEVPSLRRSYWSWRLLGEGGSVFFMSVAPDKLTTPHCEATHPRLFGQHNLDVIVWWLVCF